MGYDVYASGSFVIKADRVDEAKTGILAALEKSSKPSTTFYDRGERGVDPVTGIRRSTASLCLYFGEHLERMDCTLQQGDLCFNPPDDSFRCSDDDLWFFKLIAPYCDPDSSISFEGEDHYQWRWDIVDGQLEEVGSETIYGADVNAPAVVEQIVDLIYPDGKPVTAQQLGADNWEQLVVKIETVLRESNFGPQAGQNELDRLAQV
jgi:hypothetical protein